MQATSFLFVNKSSDSALLTRSDTNEKALILSHVQGKRRQKTARNIKSKSWAQHASYLSFHDDGPKSSGKLERERQQATILASRDNAHPAMPFKLLHYYPTHNGTDPFHSTVAGANNIYIDNSYLLSFPFLSLTKSTFLAEAFAPPSIVKKRDWMRHNKTLERRLKQCVHDDMLMHATLAYSSSIFAWALGKREKDKPPELFIGKALNAIRASLLSPNIRVDTWLLLSVYSLTITELWSSSSHMWGKCPEMASKTDPQRAHSCRTHLRALLALVDTVGGWDNVDPYVMESTILADKFLAIMHDTPPIVPPTWDPGLMPAHRQADLGIDRSSLPYLGKSLLELRMSERVTHLIHDIVDYGRIATNAWSSENLVSEDERWLFLRLQALFYRTLLLDELSVTENCVRLATLVFLLITTQYLGSFLAATLVLKRLKNAIRAMGDCRTEAEDALLQWCLCTAVMVPESCDDKDWFVDMLLLKKRRSSQPITKESLKSQIEPYLFLPTCQDHQLQMLIDCLKTAQQ